MVGCRSYWLLRISGGSILTSTYMYIQLGSAKGGFVRDTENEREEGYRSDDLEI